jgi:N-acetylglucosaminyldiphosphoundecaprenol N-acetyl-beta-D-mannosaminyltransferase
MADAATPPPNAQPARDAAYRHILGLRVDATDYITAAGNIADWAAAKRWGWVCAANVHMCMLAHDDPAFRDLVNRSLLVTSDGMPLVWMLRHLGLPRQQRVYGPDLVWHVLEAAAARGLRVGLYGGTAESLAKLMAVYRGRFPQLDIAYTHAPPFRDPTPAEDETVVRDIADAGVHILLVGLGCPKQELWMAAHHARIASVMLGVGAAFPFHAGMVRQAPRWMQRLGLEWLFRLLSEPRRLWWRYLSTNPRFAVLAIWQLLRGRRHG